MTTITVTFDGTHAFTWKGDHAGARKLVSDFDQLAASKGIDPGAFAEAAVTHFQESFNKGDSQTRKAHMIAVLYHLLLMDTGRAAYPGRCIDYVPGWDFVFDVSIARSVTVVTITGLSEAAH